MRGAVQMSSARHGGDGKDDFETPEEVMERVRVVVPGGARLLDPCTSPRNPTKAYVGFAIEQGHDGLALSWRQEMTVDDCDLAYVNPPFSQVGKWAEKMVNEANAGTSIVTLVAGRTGTRWYRHLMTVADVVAQWPGRLRFLVEGVPAPHKATFETHLLGINVSQRRFRRAFDNCQVVLP